MHKYLNALLLCCIAAVALWSIPVTINRARLESRNTAVELCLEASQMAELCAQYGETIPDFPGDCRRAGVTAITLSEEKLGTLENAGAIAIDGKTIIVRDAQVGGALSELLNVRYHVPCRNENAGSQSKLIPEFFCPGVPPFWTRDLPAGFSVEKMHYYAERGFRIFVRPENTGDAQWLSGGDMSSIAGYIVDGKEVPGYPGREKILPERIVKEGALLIPMEFSAPAGIAVLKREAGNNLVQGHVILQQELDRNQASPHWVNRWVRAVRERGNRFLLIRLWNNKTAAENLRYIVEIRTALERGGYTVSPVASPSYPAPVGRRARVYAALLAGILFPLAGIWLYKRMPAHWLPAFILVNGITLIGGLTISALLFDVCFMQRVMTVPAIKLLMVLPLLGAVAVLFSRADLVSFWHTDVKVKHIVIGLLAGVVIAVLLIRSGNASSGWLQPDRGFRELLENLLPVRPRTKEFLFGQPLLLLGLYFGNPVLILGGMVGQISIINTFYHAHSPVSLSVMRTLTGMLTGGAIGGAILLLLKAGEKRWRR